MMGMRLIAWETGTKTRTRPTAAHWRECYACVVDVRRQGYEPLWIVRKRLAHDMTEVNAQAQRNLNRGGTHLRCPPPGWLNRKVQQAKTQYRFNLRYFPSVCVFIKRMFTVLCLSWAAFTCSALFLLVSTFQLTLFWVSPPPECSLSFCTHSFTSTVFLLLPRMLPFTALIPSSHSRHSFHLATAFKTAPHHRFATAAPPPLFLDFGKKYRIGGLSTSSPSSSTHSISKSTNCL